MVLVETMSTRRLGECADFGRGFDAVLYWKVLQRLYYVLETSVWNKI